MNTTLDPSVGNTELISCHLDYATIHQAIATGNMGAGALVFSLHRYPLAGTVQPLRLTIWYPEASTAPGDCTKQAAGEINVWTSRRNGLDIIESTILTAKLSHTLSVLWNATRRRSEPSTV